MAGTMYDTVRGAGPQRQRCSTVVPRPDGRCATATAAAAAGLAGTPTSSSHRHSRNRSGCRVHAAAGANNNNSSNGAVAAADTPPAAPPAAAASGVATLGQGPPWSRSSATFASSMTAGNGLQLDGDMDRAALHDAIEEEIHTAFEHEMEMMNQSVHTAFEQEMSTAKQTMKEAVDAALEEGKMKFDVTANVNTLMAITAVITYWRGVGGLLDILLEDSLEGYVACAIFGLSVIGLIRLLKLPVVEGNGLGF